MPVVNANSVDPYQTPHSAASELGLHYLPMSKLWDARYKGLIGRSVMRYTLQEQVHKYLNSPRAIYMYVFAVLSKHCMQ